MNAISLKQAETCYAAAAYYAAAAHNLYISV